MRNFAALWNEKPLLVILIAALFLRLVAVVFSMGYAVHADHFMVIETAQAWLDGTSYSNWLPGLKVNPEAAPVGSSVAFVGLHYWLFSLFEFVGITNASSKMLLLRFLYALFSLLVVNYSYRITHLVANKDLARYVGLLMATFWILPFVSVHNFAEFFAVPFLLLATWFLVRPQFRDKPFKWAFFAGIVLGLALSIWFFVFIFITGYFAALLIKRRYNVALLCFVGFALSVILLQGVIDYFVWNQPFAEFITFLQKLEIPFTKPRHTIFSMYVIILLMVLIPPISLFWFFGWIRSAKKNLLVFLPAFFMFIFFSFSIQQHERYIMAVFPFIVISGVIGWNQILQKSLFWNNRPGLHRSMVVVFWIINFSLLFPISTMYSKRSPVEAMLYMQKHKDKVNSILIEDSNRESVKSMPLFYMESWVELYKLPKYQEYADLPEVVMRSRWEYDISTPRYFTTDSANVPDFVLFVGRKRIDERIQRLKPFLPNLTYKKTIKAGVIDRLLYKLNPSRNANQDIYIYEVSKS